MLTGHWMSSVSPAASETSSPDASVSAPQKARPIPLFARLRRGMTRAEAEALAQNVTLGGYPAKLTYDFPFNENLETIGIAVVRRNAHCATAFKALHDEAVSVLGSPTSTNRRVQGRQCEDWTLSGSVIRICCGHVGPEDGGTGWMILTALKFTPQPQEESDFRDVIH
ncbi:hypothetical protein [Corallococcus sp. 4LFB]|uniref:hypothetical protein n=1 Tax=Corallococcus sp. 4LFB TaxID=3383249 RepID=UPI0039748CF5